MSNKQLNIVYLAGGYPTADNTSHGIFNQRAANAIKDHVNLTVIHYRSYKPGRKFFEKIQENGFTRIILCVPYSPVAENKLAWINNRMFYLFTKLYTAKILQHTDLVHASDGNLSVFAAWLKKKYNFRLIAQFIGGDLNQDLPQYSAKSWMKTWKQNLDAVSFNSKALQHRFDELYGAHSFSKVIYRGVDTAVFFPSEKSNGQLVFYFLGGLPDYSTFTHGRNTKGGMNLMEAWKKIDAEIPGDGIKLLFAGPDADIAITTTWRSSLKEPGRVEISGKIDPSAIAEFHRSGNVALVPSLEEGLPNVAMEAAATGNLVIANAVGGVPEIIQDGINGIICKTNDADGLYEKLKWAIENPIQAKAIGKQAAENMKEHFSSREFGKKYADYYNSIVKNK